MPGIAEVMTVLFVSVSIMLNIVLIIDRAREPKMGTLRIEETEIGSIRYSFDIERPPRRYSKASVHPTRCSGKRGYLTILPGGDCVLRLAVPAQPIYFYLAVFTCHIMRKLIVERRLL